MIAHEPATDTGSAPVVRLRAVVIPLDGTSAALAALPVASVLAKLAGATVHLLHVGDESPPPADLLGSLGLTREQAAGCVLASRKGPAARAIAAFAIEHASSLIVVSPDAGPGPTVARELLTVARVPVVLVPSARGAAPFALRRILVPHDGTPTTAEALRPAIALAQAAEALLRLFHVARTDPRGAPGETAPDERGTLRAPFYADQPQHEWPAWTREFLERASRSTGDPPRMSLALASGDPASEIVRRAREEASDLVVLAWRGSLEPGRSAVFRTVIGEAPCPVLVVRALDR